MSYFNTYKKQVAWKIWKSYPEVTDKIIKLGDLPSKESADLVFPIIESFTALVYKRIITIDEVLREMLVKHGRDLKTIPPTSAALLEHTFHAVYIAGHMWNNSLVSSRDLPQPNEWG